MAALVYMRNGLRWRPRSLCWSQMTPIYRFSGPMAKLLPEAGMLMDQVQGKEKHRGLLPQDLLFCQLHFTSRYSAVPLGGHPGT